MTNHSGESMYHVWRRSDGYVSCSKGKKAPQSNGRDTFDVLLSTLDWPEAQARIEAERDAKHFAVVESWGAESGRSEPS